MLQGRMCLDFSGFPGAHQPFHCLLGFHTVSKCGTAFSEIRAGQHFVSSVASPHRAQLTRPSEQD